MRFGQKMALAAAATAALLMLGGCSAPAAEKLANGDEKKVTLAVFNGWDEGIAASELWRAVLTERGYDVTLKYADVAPVFAGLAANDYDFVLDSWLPVMHGEYLKKYGADVEDLGAWFPDGRLTIAVNADAPINTLEELQEHAGEFGNRIMGIESGASYMKAVQERLIPDYGLTDITLATSSTPAMLAELKTALGKGENIAVTMWHPHWAYDAFELKDLPDPKGSLGETEGVHAVASGEFGTRFPTLHRWISEFRMDGDTLNSLENAMFNDRKGDLSELVREWMDQNPEYVATLAQ